MKITTLQSSNGLEPGMRPNRSANPTGLAQPLPGKILVVDDEKNIRLTVRHSLMAADYDVETADDGSEGLAKITTEHYDLVLMDLRMPQMSGTEMIRQLRHAGNTIPAIVISAYLSIESLLEALSLGVTDFVRKPFTPGEIRAVVRDVITRESRLQGHAATDDKLALEHAKLAVAHQDIPGAIIAASRALESSPEDPESYAFLGLLQQLEGNRLSAEHCFRKALQLNPQHLLTRDFLFWSQGKDQV